MSEEVQGIDRVILRTLRDRSSPIGEDEYHCLNNILDESGRGLGFEDYELKHWHDVNPEFRSDFGASYFSQGLHDIIERLIEGEFVRRNPKNPIEIEYAGGIEDDN